MILYQLDKKQAVIGIVSSDILSATFEEQINTAGNLKFTVAKKMRDDCLYVLFQRPSATTYMCFKILTETQEDDQVSYTAVESAYDELGAYSYIKDLRPQNRTAKEMLTQLLAQTRYSVGYVADTGTQTTNFYYTTVLASLQSVVNLFNLEITFDVVFDPIDNQVKKRMVNLYQQQGSRTGRRFEYGDKLLSVTCEQSSDELVTALVGRGSSVQVSEGTDGSPDGYSRKITFADIVWKKSAGNPLDKPAGQEYLEDPAATAVYGFSDGKPRIGFVEFDKIDDKNLLIKATYDKLQELKRPKVSFKASVTDVGNLNLGDTVAIIRHDLKIEYLTRVYKVTHDLLNRQNNTIELGDDFQKASITSTISAVQDTVQSAKEYSQSALQSANGKNTNFYGTNQPLFAVEGDLWYKDLGNGETEMYQYKNGNWELITSTAELHNVQKVVDQAKADMVQAKTDAQTAYDEAIKATSTANGAKVETAKALEQAKQANDSYTALAKEVADNKSSVDADYKQAQADIAQAQKDLASVTGTVSEVKKGQGELSAKVAGKVDNTVYQTYVKQTNQSLSEKLVASDLRGYAKTADVKQTTDGLSASITKVQGDLSGLQIGGANLLDGTAGPWKQAGIGKDYADTVGFVLSKQPQSTTITVSFDCRANVSKDFYCFFYGNDYDANGGVTSACNSQHWVNNSIGMDGTVPITPTTTWNRVWIRYNLSKIPPAGTKTLLIGRLYSNYATSDWLEIRNVKLESGSKATDWCKSDYDVQSQINMLSGKITATSDRLSSVYTKSEVDGKLGTKVEQSVLTQTSNSLSASIVENSKALSRNTDKITQLTADVNGVKTTVADHTGKITQLTTDVNGVKSTVSNKVDKTVYQSYVTQTDKALSAKLTASDLRGYAKTADVKQTTDGLSASITKVQGDLNGLQIGGANLLDKTAGPWKQAGIGKDYADTVGFILKIQPQTTTVTVSFDCRASASKDFYCFFWGDDYNANGGVTSACNSQNLVNTSIGMDGMVPITPSTTWKRVWIRYNLSKIPPAGTKQLLIGRLYSDYSTSDWLEIRNVKLESGSKATDWCKSDYDVQSQLDTLSGKITATSDRLSSVYTKSEVDGKLGTKVEQSALTQTSNNLSASIAKNSKILSSIGLKDDTAYINANKIALNGKTLMTSTLMGNAVIDDAFIGSLSADKITTGTLNAANVNIINLDASKITTGTLTAVEMHQTDWLADTWINGEGIHNQMGDYNVWIKRGKLAAFDSRGQGMYMESGRLTLASCAYWQTNLKDEKIDYGVIKCDDNIFGRKGIGVIGKGGFTARTDNCDLSYLNGSIFTSFSGAGIIGDDAGRMMLGGDKAIFIMAGQIYENESILGMQDRPYIRIGGRASNSQAWAEGDDGSSIVINAWDIVLRACGKTNRNIIMNKLTYNGEHTINLNDDTNDLWWGPKMHAPSFVNTSALSKKMNIKKLDVQTAINAIKNTDIYDYQFKEFGETGKHYASLIIDDVNDKPQYKAAGAFVDGLGRDDGTQLGYLTVVVQSLLKEIDILKERIDK